VIVDSAELADPVGSVYLEPIDASRVTTGASVRREGEMAASDKKLDLRGQSDEYYDLLFFKEAYERISIATDRGETVPAIKDICGALGIDPPKGTGFLKRLDARFKAQLKGRGEKQLIKRGTRRKPSLSMLADDVYARIVRPIEALSRLHQGHGSLREESKPEWKLKVTTQNFLLRGLLPPIVKALLESQDSPGELTFLEHQSTEELEKDL
jgi:hypothetical protein